MNLCNMKNSKAVKIAAVAGVLLLVFLLVPSDIQAQCPMCRMSAESNLKNGGTDGRGLNAGILYMLLLPYLLVGSIGVWWWRNRRNENQQVAELTDKDFVQE